MPHRTRRPRRATTNAKCRMQDAREISKRGIVHRDRRGRYPPFTALCGMSRDAAEWGHHAEAAHRVTKLSVLGQLRSCVNSDQSRSNVILASNSKKSPFKSSLLRRVLMDVPGCPCIVRGRVSPHVHNESVISS